MNYVSAIMAIFAILGAADYALGNKFGLGKEFERGFSLFGNMALSMIGMISLAPVIGDIMQPVSRWLYSSLGLDPSIIPAMLFANDMGGAPLSVTMAQSPELGLFNGLVVTSMMGCTVSFTIPMILSIVNKEKHKFVLSGLLYGIITVPIGCFISGLLLNINIITLLYDLLPMIIFSVLVALGIFLIPKICIKIFSLLGIMLKILIIFGLSLAIIEFLLDIQLIKGLAPLEEGALVCVNACVVISGAFPLLFILSKIIAKPLSYLGEKLNISEISAKGLFSSLATSITTFPMMNEMDNKGIVLNSAFAVSAAFTFAGHLAFTLSFEADYVLFVIIGKLISGITALVLSAVAYKHLKID